MGSSSTNYTFVEEVLHTIAHGIGIGIPLSIAALVILVAFSTLYGDTWHIASTAVFYAWEKLAFNHAIWHLFVLVGSALHFFSILFYVVPGANHLPV